ncbi:MAG: DUF1501 domain-containing protein [Pirellulales bacterium]|nr:DUF1501 domain-containing protein [Pirellulales bacterium]
MLRVLGSHRRLCSGVSRRDFLHAGALALSGLGLGHMGLADLLRLQAAAGESGGTFGKAKSIILLHLYGSPSQLEWADPKPLAPVEIRGELGTISSSLTGCGVCELLPNMAKVMDRTTVIRSMTHPYPIHGVAYALTGTPTIDVAMELAPHDPRHWPFFGSVVEYVDRLKRDAGAGGAPAATPGIPPNLALPFPMSTRRVGEVPRAGPYAAFLGAQYNPVWTEFVGTATRGIRKELAGKVFADNDPYLGVAPDSYFMIPSATDPQPGVTLNRLDSRRGLLAQLEQERRTLDATSAGLELDRHQETAFSLLHSAGLREALDLRREDTKSRALYGDRLFGQACLAARRLVEAGSRVVTVFWDEFGLAGDAWDTHYNHFERMRTALCPGLDEAWYGLITDLDQRGLLDDTLVVCTSEHGRTPRFTGTGRDHWSRAYTTLVAGGGTARGRIVGATDKIGSDVTDRPVSPKDLLATMYHLLGIDHRTWIHDALGRPLPLVDGEVVHEALA